VTRKVSDLYCFIPETHRRNSMTDWDLWLFFRPNNIYWAESKQRKHVTKNVHSDTAYQFIILHSTFLVLCSFKWIRFETTMRNEIHLSKVFVTWVFVAKARTRETIAHKLVNTRLECSPFVQFISWEMTQVTTLLLICFSSRNCQLTFGQYCNTIQSSKL